MPATRDHGQVWLEVACENIRFSSLFAARDVSRGGTSATQRQNAKRETSLAAKSEEKRMFSQARLEVETADAMVDGIDDYKLIHVGDVTGPTRGHVPQRTGGLAE